MTPPLVSCIVPVHNGERFLSATLNSALGQTHRPLEVVVVDDGSDDGTPEVAASFAASVRYIREARQGPAAARNRGIHEAQGDFICFLDADDLWHADKTRRQLSSIGPHPMTRISLTYIRNFEGDPAPDSPVFSPALQADDVPGYTACSFLAPRPLFDRVGLFDARLKHSSFADWILRARRHAVETVMIEESLVYRRLHDSNRSRRHAQRSRDEYLMLLKHSLDQKRGVQRDRQVQAADGPP